MQIREFLKKIFQSKNNPNKELLISFQQRRNEIQRKNKAEIIGRLMKTIRKEMLRTDGLLINDIQARRTALEIFNTAKEMGCIDSMNKAVKRGA